MSDDERRYPRIITKPQFTDDEKADLTNRPAREAYWQERIAAHEKEIAKRVYPTLPVEERAAIMHDFLHPEEKGRA